MTLEEVSKEFIDEGKHSFGDWARRIVHSRPFFFVEEFVKYLPKEATGNEISDLITLMGQVMPDHIKKHNLFRFEREILESEGIMKITLLYRGVRYEQD